MKTIIHITLSDVERNDLAKRIDRDPVTERLVTRKEVTELVHTLIQDEITTGWESTTDDRGPQIEAVEREREPESNEDVPEGGRGEVEPVPRESYATFIPTRGDEDYIARPRDPKLATACSSILDNIALIEAYVWETITRNQKK